MIGEAGLMNGAIFLKDTSGTQSEPAGWFLFKAFPDLDRAIQSHDSFNGKGFDCLLVLVKDAQHLDRVWALLN